MNKTYYVCKYTPLELLQAFWAECANLNGMPQGFELADQIAYPNLCGFGKALLEAVMRGEVKELVLVNCCDAIRSVYDILEDSGRLDFLYLLDMLHTDGSCSRERVSMQLRELAEAYVAYREASFDENAFRAAFRPPEKMQGPHLGVLGARMGAELFQMVEKAMPFPVKNATCVNNRSVGAACPPEGLDFGGLMEWYAGELLGQAPCMRMTDHAGRKQLYNDPDARTVVDIGGQDSKVIRLNGTGTVVNFVINDKCAAGTGRFLEMMARTMEMDLSEMAGKGLDFEEDITISSMCTVFAESEVVSLIAQNKPADDIVHGLNKAVAAKTAALGAALFAADMVG